MFQVSPLSIQLEKKKLTCWQQDPRIVTKSRESHVGLSVRLWLDCWRKSSPLAVSQIGIRRKCVNWSHTMSDSPVSVSMKQTLTRGQTNWNKQKCTLSYLSLCPLRHLGDFLFVCLTLCEISVPSSYRRPWQEINSFAACGSVSCSCQIKRGGWTVACEHKSKGLSANG